jgi:hypothetical protein
LYHEERFILLLALTRLSITFMKSKTKINVGPAGAAPHSRRRYCIGSAFGQRIPDANATTCPTRKLWQDDQRFFIGCGRHHRRQPAKLFADMKPEARIYRCSPRRQGSRIGRSNAHLFSDHRPSRELSQLA